MPRHSTAQHSTAQHSTAQHSTAQHINSRNSVVTTPYDINPLDGSESPSSGFLFPLKERFLLVPKILNL
ncbi:hypothetical protein CCAN11_2410034 [Capnocytophaga canimorsus]|uniref:Uncharacterized protein n=1 Tax=Capnocytophaga canimorsus TaxID=28188 RepID=A0A0B7IQ72_9FLAO|nr:hypothetical protein [Capnocytophaga canimorsus]CEN52138.1 hypothetical protein CCAN11_2410034 [Capnocytophaga canimorsus]